MAHACVRGRSQMHTGRERPEGPGRRERDRAARAGRKPTGARAEGRGGGSGRSVGSGSPGLLTPAVGSRGQPWLGPGPPGLVLHRSTGCVHVRLCGARRGAHGQGLCPHCWEFQWRFVSVTTSVKLNRRVCSSSTAMLGNALLCSDHEGGFGGDPSCPLLPARRGRGWGKPRPTSVQGPMARSSQVGGSPWPPELVHSGGHALFQLGQERARWVPEDGGGSSSEARGSAAGA